jgi:hypothetical protein
MARDTFSPADQATNIKNQQRVIRLAGSIDRVIFSPRCAAVREMPDAWPRGRLQIGAIPRFVSDAKST